MYKRQIDAYLIRHPSRTVLVPVTGDSMLDAGIRPGDRVVVERDVPARPGDVVAVSYTHLDVYKRQLKECL